MAFCRESFYFSSSQVHRCNGRIYDRNEDGDFDITGKHEGGSAHLKEEERQA